MKKEIKVSIVLPVHNGEKYLREALDGCLNQTYKHYEIIVIDDESTDGTSRILSEYDKKHSNLKVFSVEKQESLGAVLNIGIINSSGEYIARMDADDIMSPTRLQKQAEFLDNYPEMVAVGGQIETIDMKGEVIGARTYPLDDKSLKKMLFVFQPFAHPAMMIRREALIKVGMYPPERKIEDLKLIFLLSREGQFANVPDTVLKYRISFDSESQADMLGHFRKTNTVRKWAIKKLGIKPSLKENLLWNVEKMFVPLASLLPNKLFIGVFELARRLLS